MVGRIVIAMCLMSALFCGCKAMEQMGWTPEGIIEAGENVEELGKYVPGAPGDAVAIIGWLLGIAGAGWGAYKTTQGNKYKKAFTATARGIDRAEERLPAEALSELHDALFTEQAKSGAVETVARLRNGMH